jgi:hypothetical protein
MRLRTRTQRAIYYSIFVALALSTIGFLFFRLPILYFCYGFDQSLINSYDVASYAAYRVTAPAKLWWLVSIVILSLSCVVFSSLVIKRETNAYHLFMERAILTVSICTSLILGFGLIGGLVAPSGILGLGFLKK